jgi:GDP/GTP exchange factor required for growth at low temperature
VPLSINVSTSGVYLSQMRHISELPDTIDPTAPRERVARGTQPAHPEVFAALPPLPKSMPLNVLVNIQKQRRIAGVVQALVSGQHLAARVQYAVDRKVYQRCLRLRALDYDSLRNAMDLQGM